MAKVFKTLGVIVQAILEGELLLRLKMEKTLPKIAYVFFLLVMTILFHFYFDESLGTLEKNIDKLESLQIVQTQMDYERARLDSRSYVEGLLEDMGSNLREPTSPATKVNR